MSDEAIRKAIAALARAEEQFTLYAKRHQDSARKAKGGINRGTQEAKAAANYALASTMAAALEDLKLFFGDAS